MKMSMHDRSETLAVSLEIEATQFPYCWQARSKECLKKSKYEIMENTRWLASMQKYCAQRISTDTVPCQPGLCFDYATCT